MPAASYRWILVAAGGLLGCIAMGAMFALPVLILPISRDTGWSVTGVSTAMTIGFLAMAAGSLGWGALSDKLGPRAVVLAGSALLAASLALAARADQLLVFQLVFGLGVGGAAAAIFSPLIAAVTGWFDTQRSLAVSLVSAGMGLAPMTLSPLVAWLVTTHDWRTTLTMVAGLAAVVMVPVSLVVRRPPALQGGAAAEAPAPAGDPEIERMTTRQALASPQFAVLLITNFFCCATHSGPIIHTVSYAVTCGIPMIAAVSIYSVEGLAGMGGRLGFGLMGDRFGAKPVLVAGLLAQALAALGYVAAGGLATFYVAAAVFGFIYAGVMPLYAVLARENFPLRLMGTVIGAVSMAGSLGMATGPVVGGLIYDEFGSYRWLYFGACAMGLLAVAIAMTFRPAGRSGLAPAAA